MRYRMIGIDLDGTLLGPDGQVSSANAAAVRRALAAGVLVTPCTGRGWCEANIALSGVAPWSLGVYATGAAVCDVSTGQTIDLAALEPHVACDAVQVLRGCPEAVLVFRERGLVGHDYLVTGDGELIANTQWWFQFTNAAVHYQREVGPRDLHHCMRVGMVAPGSLVAARRAQLEQRLGDQVIVQSFEALHLPDEADSIHVLEVFAAGVDKWRGLTWIAGQRGIAPHQIAAIGDEVNDVSMLKSAGCGIAMGNAVPAARAAARHVTAGNSEDGVAMAIDKMLAGEW
jgi:hydroxymethylpyrimidine pyrophosphatase-like HAD family hydrolase